MTVERGGQSLPRWMAACPVAGADQVDVLALPDLTGLSVVCRTGADTGVTAELFFDKYQGDWNALLNALFAADVRKVSHNVKDLGKPR